MNINDLLSKHTKLIATIKSLTAIKNDKSILLGSGAKIWADEGSRFYDSLKSEIVKELELLDSELKSIDNKIEAVNTLLQQDL